jgi:hypothetical protein
MDVAVYNTRMGTAHVAPVTNLACRTALSYRGAIISEGIHSLVDTGNAAYFCSVLLKSKKPADEERPFGYGKELISGR